MFLFLINTCKTNNKNKYGHHIKIDGPSEVIYSPNKPLPCGAKVWIETDSKYLNIDGLNFDAE